MHQPSTEKEISQLSIDVMPKLRRYLHCSYNEHGGGGISLSTGAHKRARVEKIDTFSVFFFKFQTFLGGGDDFRGAGRLLDMMVGETLSWRNSSLNLCWREGFKCEYLKAFVWPPCRAQP